jgi:DNA-binding response OmpR family regulator
MADPPSPSEAVPVPNSILVVDDDLLFRRSLAFLLEQAGYQVQMAASAEAALTLVAAAPPDLVLLDVGLPGMDGLEALRRIRAAVPVILVTARRREIDEVLGLELGAEDYVTKPFEPNVLLARIRTVLRRGQPAAEMPTVAHAGDLVVDPAHHAATIAGRTLQLSPLEFRLLHTLALAAGQVLSAEQLLTRVWGSGYQGEPQTVYVYIRALREKIEENPQSPRRIVTVRGVGYQLIPQGNPADA